MVIKKNLLLVRYSFERLAKLFKGGGLQRGWGEKVTIQRTGARKSGVYGTQIPSDERVYRPSAGTQLYFASAPVYNVYLTEGG
jgi:hypothetical protein